MFLSKRPILPNAKESSWVQRKRKRPLIRNTRSRPTGLESGPGLHVLDQQCRKTLGEMVDWRKRICSEVKLPVIYPLPVTITVSRLV